MTYAIVILIFIHWALFHYVFEFQRITLKLSRIHLGKGDADYQALLTPKRISVLGIVLKVFAVLVSVVIGYHFGWLYGIGYYILTGLVGIFGWVGMLFSFPRDPYCFDLIEKHLTLQISNENNQLEEVLKAVQKTRTEKEIN